MKKSLLTLTLLIGIGSSLFAQKQTGEIPFSWKGKMQLPDLSIQTVVMPQINMQQVHVEDAINDASGKVQRMTVYTTTNYTINNSGTWFQLPNGDRVWKLKVRSQGAMGIAMIFDQWGLMPGEKLHIYNEAHTDLLGAYTYENNKAHGQMSVQHLLGDVAILEYYQPAGLTTSNPFKLTQVGHAYRQLYRGPNQHGSPLLLGSDPCEVDVNCSEGNNWQDQISGACRIYVVGGGSGGWCSGTLINNTAQDCKPYILTAFHCGTSSNTSDFNNYIFYFNYESAGCGSGSAPTNQTLSGCTKRADSGDGGGNSGSDFLLVEANAASAATTLQGYGAFWNGWNSANTASPNGVSIHHPAGDRKKISTYTSALSTTQWGSGSGSHWLVDWVGTTNGHGVTEGGSSGSPIFDTNKRVVGQLTGGSSYCTQVPNTSPDLYGKMSYNWNSNPGDDLDDWLDPINSGATTLDGVFYPCSAASPDDAGITAIVQPGTSSCGATFSPIVTLRNYGSSTLTSVNINTSLDAAPAVVTPWTGSLAAGASVDVTLNAITTSAGSHSLDVYTTLPNGVTDGNAANDQSSSTFVVNTTGVQVDFSLTTDCWGSETTWEVVNGSGTTVLSGGPYTDIVGGETINETWCLSAGCYDFIINDTYGDGMYGSQYGSCTVDGTYSIVDPLTGTLATIIAANSDFGNQETNNFCVSTTLTSLFSTNNTTVCVGTTINFIDQSAGNPNSWDWTFPGGSPGTSSTQNPSVTYTTPGTYDVSLLVGDGTGTDASTLSNYITVVDVPTGTVSATDESCAGACDGTVSANVSGGTTPYSYGWSSGIGTTATVSNVCSGTYSLVLTDDNGCVLSGLSATVNAGQASPTAGFTASATTVYISNGGNVDFTNTSSGGTSYDWNFGDGNVSTSQDPSHAYTTAGTYTVTLTVTNVNGCTDVFTMNIIVLLEDSIYDPALENAISMYPNPTSGMISIKIDMQDLNGAYVRIFNDIGAVIAEVPVQNQEITNIDLSDFAHGLYFVAVHVDDKMIVRKVSLTQ